MGATLRLALARALAKRSASCVFSRLAALRRRSAFLSSAYFTGSSYRQAASHNLPGLLHPLAGIFAALVALFALLVHLLSQRLSARRSALLPRLSGFLFLFELLRRLLLRLRFFRFVQAPLGPVLARAPTTRPWEEEGLRGFRLASASSLHVEPALHYAGVLLDGLERRFVAGLRHRLCSADFPAKECITFCAVAVRWSPSSSASCHQPVATSSRSRRHKRLSRLAHETTRGGTTTDFACEALP